MDSLEQIKTCELPLHPTMISLIDYFVRANVPETRKEFNNCQPTMDYEKLVKVKGVDIKHLFLALSHFLERIRTEHI